MDFRISLIIAVTLCAVSEVSARGKRAAAGRPIKVKPNKEPIVEFKEIIEGDAVRGDTEISSNIHIKSGQVTIQSPIVTVKGGVEVVVSGKLHWKGTASSPSVVKPQGAGAASFIIVILPGGSCLLEYVAFSSFVSEGGLIQVRSGGSLTVVQSSFESTGTAIWGEEGSKVTVSASRFAKTTSDAIAGEGIVFNAISGNTFDNCNGSINVRSLTTPATIDNNYFIGNTRYAVSVESASSRIVISSNNFLRGNEGALLLRGVGNADGEEKSLLTNNTFRNNVVNSGDDVYARYNLIYAEGSTFDFTENTLIANGVQQSVLDRKADISLVNLWDSTVRLLRNEFYDSAQAAHLVVAGGQQDSSSYRIKRNIFYNNTGVQFYVVNDGPSLINARENFWQCPSDDPQEVEKCIRGKIKDFETDESLGAVLHSPWLKEPNKDGSLMNSTQDEINSGSGYDDSYGGYMYHDYYDSFMPREEANYEVINGTVVWEKTDIKLTRNLLVTKFGSLTVLGSVRVEIAEGKSIRVDGVLKVLGDVGGDGENDFVQFSVESSHGDKGWKSIIFTSSAQPYDPTSQSGCILQGVKLIRGGYSGKVDSPATGMVVVAGTRILIDKVIFVNSFTAGLSIAPKDTTSVTVTDSIFRDNADHGIAHHAKSLLTVKNTQFINNHKYAIAAKEGPYDVQGCHFMDNENGVLCSSTQRSTSTEADFGNDTYATSVFQDNIVQRNIFHQGDSCWERDETNNYYRLIAFGSHPLIVKGNVFENNRVPLKALHNNAALDLLIADRATEFSDNTFFMNTGALRIGSLFLPDAVHPTPTLDISSNSFSTNDHFQLLVTANNRKVAFNYNNVTDNIYSTKTPIPDIPMISFNGQDQQVQTHLQGNQFLANRGTSTLLRIGIPTAAQFNLFDDQSMKREVFLMTSDATLTYNWWGNETEAGVKKRIILAPSIGGSSKELYAHWMLADGTFVGTSEQTVHKERERKANESEGGVGVGVSILIAICVILVMILLYVFLRTSKPIKHSK